MDVTKETKVTNPILRIAASDPFYYYLPKNKTARSFLLTILVYYFRTVFYSSSAK